eukprot:8605135-Lingulodinium_polyedra.AAC.1
MHVFRSVAGSERQARGGPLRLAPVSEPQGPMCAPLLCGSVSDVWLTRPNSSSLRNQIGRSPCQA